MTGFPGPGGVRPATPIAERHHSEPTSGSAKSVTAQRPGGTVGDGETDSSARAQLRQHPPPRWSRRGCRAGAPSTPSPRPRHEGRRRRRMRSPPGARPAAASPLLGRRGLGQRAPRVRIRRATRSAVTTPRRRGRRFPPGSRRSGRRASRAAAVRGRRARRRGSRRRPSRRGSSRARSRRSITSAPVCVSRFPVGSSARITRGPTTSARAIATRCCSPPERCAGRCDARSARPTSSSSTSERSRSSSEGDADRRELRLDVLERRQRRDQVELLEDEAERVQAEIGELAVAERGEIATLEEDAARARPVERPEQLQQGRLARPARPLERDELARLDLEVDPARPPR